MSGLIDYRSRDIVEVLHFTTNRGVVGVLASGELLSRRRLPENKYLKHVLRYNSTTRPEESQGFDKSEDWLDYVNMSISEVNSRFFKLSSRWHDGVWWAILSFDPVILTHEGVQFATTNCAYDLCMRQGGKEGFDSLFVDFVARKSSPSWGVCRNERPPMLPTCEQAEVLYPQAVSCDHLRRIYVANGEHSDVVYSWFETFDLPVVDVVVDQEKFLGKQN